MSEAHKTTNIDCLCVCTAKSCHNQTFRYISSTFVLFIKFNVVERTAAVTAYLRSDTSTTTTREKGRERYFGPYFWR